MTRGTAAVEKTYGPDRSRILRKDYAGTTLTSTTRYVGGYEKVTLASGVVEQRHYIAGVAVITKVGTGATFKETYLLTDHLGSVIATVDLNRLPENGYIGDRTSFDAFGLRRTADWKAMSLSSLYSFKSLISERGYTGHEQLDAVGLIHMNGRVYDPVIGRFISADPIIQAPGDLQSYNRYSYVFNNPLTLTDPSGFYSWSDFRDKVLKPVAGAIFTGGLSLHVKLADKGLREFGRFARKNKFVAEAVQIGGCAMTGPLGCVAITSGVRYGVTDGDTNAAVKAGAIAFVQANLSGAIGKSPDLIGLGEVLAHGALGGAVSVAQGGKFGAGFAAGAFGKAVNVGIRAAGGYGGLLGKR